MSKYSLALFICFLGLAAALQATSKTTLNPTLKKNYFFVDYHNTFPSELYQTRNGIVAFSIEGPNKANYTSQYLLIDIPARDAKPILKDIAKACELVTPTFQPLHYHVQTDSLVYFCYANNSLLLIDQSNYSVETVIPFNISGGWPVVKLSTDGMSVAVLLMDSLFTTTAKASMLVKVDLQVRQVIAEIWLNQGFGVAEAVVAYASNKKAAYLATNRIQADSIATTIYTFITIGSSYQITPIVTASASIAKIKIVTKLFCVGNYVVANNGTDMLFVNQDGIYTRVPQLLWKSITNDQQGLFHLVMTSQYGSNDIYIQTGAEGIYKYTVVENAIHSKDLGGAGDIQIVYGNQTSGDLMFTTSYTGVTFNIIDLKTLQSIYTAVVGYESLMLTDSTYAISSDYLYIYDLKTDALLAKLNDGIYHYSKEQNLVSFWNGTDEGGCELTHIDLTTAKRWTTMEFYEPNSLCDLWPTSLRITENGTPEFVQNDFVKSNVMGVKIFTESYGELDFAPADALFNKQSVNFDFDNLTFYFADYNPRKNTTNITLYAYNPQSQALEAKGSHLFENLNAYNGLYTLNKTATVALANNTVTILNGLDQTLSASFSGDWNSASSFEDSDGNEYVVLTKRDIRYTPFLRGTAPGLFSTSGNFVPLPGVRAESIRAEAAGANSYWIADALGFSVGLVRYYDAGSRSDGQQTLISI